MDEKCPIEYLAGSNREDYFMVGDIIQVRCLLGITYFLFNDSSLDSSSLLIAIPSTKQTLTTLHSFKLALLLMTSATSGKTNIRTTFGLILTFTFSSFSL
jgi:hypothetical protein